MAANRLEKLRFRPTFRATVIALPAFLVIVGLGTWQVHRLAWKTELIAYREAQLAASPVALSDVADGGVAMADFRRVTVRGEYLHDREIFVGATRDGRVGFHVVTPLRRSDGSAVLVDRGWIPSEARAQRLRADGQVEGLVTVEGVIRSTPRRGAFTPDNDLAKNYWFWFDFAAMAAFADVAAPAYVVEAGPAGNPGGLPIGREFSVGLRNEHLQYVITWYILAVALAVIYVLSQCAPRDPGEAAD